VVSNPEFAAIVANAEICKKEGGGDNDGKEKERSGVYNSPDCSSIIKVIKSPNQLEHSNQMRY